MTTLTPKPTKRSNKIDTSLSLKIHLNSRRACCEGSLSFSMAGEYGSTSSQKQITEKIRGIDGKHCCTKNNEEVSIDYQTRISSSTHDTFASICKFLPQETFFVKEDKSLLRLDQSKKPLQLSFRLRQVDKQNYVFSQLLHVNGNRIAPNHHSSALDYGIITDSEHLYFWENKEDLAAFLQTKVYDGVTIPSKDIVFFFNQVVQPLFRNYVVHIDAEIIQSYISKKKPKPLLSISQDSDKVHFELQFSYDKVEVTPPVLQRYYTFSEDGVLVQVERNEDEETHWLDELIAMHSDFKLIDQFKWELPNKFFIPSWSDFFFSHLEQHGIRIKKNEATGTDEKTYIPTVQMSIEQGEDYFDVHLNIRINQTEIPTKIVQKAILENSKEIFIQNQSFLLADNWIKKYRNVLIWGKIVHGKLRFLHYQEHLLEPLCQGDPLFKKEKSSRKVDKNASLPSNINGELRDYQKEGFQWINILCQTNRGGILADDMGLGKTIQTLAQLLKFQEAYKKLNALIVCPASLINNWKDEITKFAPSLSYMIYHSQDRAISNHDLKNHQIIITSYNILQKDIKHLKNILFDYIILDESQYIKNPYSKTAKSVFALNGKHRLCLSGTPLQNHTFDIYSQIHFLNPNVLGSIENFKNKFSILIDQFEEKEPQDELKQLLDPFILRRTKKQVAKDLPEKSESIVYCQMEEEQREIYDYYRERYRNYLLSKIKKDGIQRSKLHVLQGLTFLRQICDCPNLMKEQVDFHGEPIKIKILKERMIPKDGENKALIFSQFIGMLDRVQKTIKKDGWEYAYFDGKTPIEQRSKEIERFQSDPNCKLFLISIKAGNVGLNLTAADYVYLIDPWWNPAIEQQAIDRTHRIGQKKNIFSFKFICEDTIEEKILLLQRKKSNLADNLVTLNQNSLLKTLNSEDIEYLFSD